MNPFSPDLLRDKVIIVTGGATGLGQAMSEQFAELGAKLAICGRRQTALDQAAEVFRSKGQDIYVQSCDVRDPVQVSEFVKAVYSHYGKVDILVNNAAGNFISPTERLSHRAVDSILGIVLHGTFYMTLEVGKQWIELRHPGTILNIVTTYASTGSGYVTPSAAAKAGVLALTRSLAVEWAPYGIRQVAIAPGAFPTDGADSRLSPTPELQQQLIDRIPIKRAGSKEELTHLAAFLISDYAGFINGEVITIDGGEWLQGAGQFNGLSEVTDEQWDELARMTRNGK
ncbi:SDR family oxidoreductase [Paenibacillus urinalis]|uniref:SDR family oxidoreductase n=1 Tax=Paenibacillus urinalis TaxID=521520 RepID=A0AAX3N582_9BACL|nr:MULTISPECIES: SDR family oxidoreductase [Paenibacillus]WDH84838.1 SDR family oxidoreductase [Paenibacillus urinalis]WDH96297.1 SDR family oxidoreductase [Paenibacillus urinalis]WDI04520.1 SDR family oxidoreductase [Paenibacillus urinalis]GAK42748.1 short-chain dehydrogenase/reductase SDR [Paenibacillus sp. TCA20]